METLLEYLTFVKGIGYLLVIAFLLAFLTFWKLTQIKEKKILKVVPVIAVIWLTFGVASVAVTHGNANSTANPVSEPRTEKWLTVNTTEYSAIGSAADFHNIMSAKISCRDCHHKSGDEIRACRDCHDVPFNPENMSKPGIKAAIHERCMQCHKEVFRNPDSCKSCHTKEAQVSLKAPAPPHKLTWEDCARCHEDSKKEIKIVYHDFCINCHAKGIAGAEKMPADHAGRTGDTCRGCHLAGGGKYDK